MQRIYELPQMVVDQIAAGEVIERPASVVKELVENSLDAGAGKVSVHIEEGGRKTIIVSDNGAGIHPDDVPLAFRRHATSKIRSVEDLLLARTLGFRGEALSSIASVAQILLRSRPGNLDVGVEYILSPGQEAAHMDWTGSPGTTIEVRDLFHNLPVRLKFLKSVSTEQSQVQETLSFLALGHPEVQFHLSVNGRSALALPARTERQLRLLDLYSGLTERDLVRSVLEGEGIRVEALVLTPDKNRKDRKYQNIFLNNRWIRHPGLLHAISQGASGRVHKDVHPGAWVWIEMVPDKVDVNVHPTKREVRFLETDRLFSLVRRVVQEGLDSFLERKPLELEESAGQKIQPSRTSLGIFQKGDSGTFTLREGEGIRKSDSQAEAEPPVFRKAWTSVSPRPSHGGSNRPTKEPLAGRHADFEILPEILKNLPPAPFAFDRKGPRDPAVRILSQVYETFILAFLDQDLVVVDQHTAHERIRYDAFRKGLAHGKITMLPYLFPETVRMAAREVENLEQRIDELAHLGFDVDIQGPESVRVSGIPSLLEGENPGELLEELSESSQGFEWPLVRSDRIDETLMTLSCHTSIRANHTLGKEDLARIVRTLLLTEFPFSCPHGRPTILSLSRSLLEKWFHRS
ncbi:MAG: DNA mismatch repair endonuclease MutL [Nitrospirae bacterium]|nr:DNA mismatch repair endonuclease MutL [Nitrospirota bacterium]MDA8150404.1 DNA mismatch repair endonuclease MutL [Nitrospiraceae bacterium]